jgi:sulfite oxidase
MTVPNRLVHDAEGLNSGTWAIPSAEGFITPVDRFFTRSHAPIPDLDPVTWRLEVDGLVDRPRSFSLDELTRTFSGKTLTATLICAGLRRLEFLAQGPLPGELPWGPEPASNGEWTGVGLGDLLRHVRVKAGARHVELTGLDRVERHGHRFGFGGSIDIEKALHGDVILATGLNGAPLPPANGYPLRVVVPGWVGARSIKWLGRITVSDHPSTNYFQSKAYRVQREVNPDNPRDVSAGVAMSATPINAVILEPLAEQKVPAGRVMVRGWAMGSEARPLTSVEVSPNDGHAWVPARISVAGREWTWSFWEAELSLGPGRHTLVVRATDSAGTVQPEHLGDTWNVKGYGNNAWYRVTVRAG